MRKPRGRTRAHKKHPHSVKRARPVRWIAANRPKLGVWLLMFGILLITFPAAYKTLVGLRRQETVPVSEVKDNSVSPTYSSDPGPFRIHQTLLSAIEPSQPPQRIVIPSISVDLPIVEARVTDGLWELSENSASHGVGSANPGQNGNTVIFAHARNELFGPLRNVKKDATVYVLSKDRWYRYRIIETRLVAPHEVEVIASTDDEILTLFTCSGFLDAKRLIIRAHPLR